MSLFLYMVWGCVLTSLIYMKPFSFPNNTCWKDYLFSIVYSCLLCWRLNDLAATAAKLLQLCPTLCDPIDSSPPVVSIHGILQARTLEWVAISFSNAWKWKVKVKSLSRVRLPATPWTAAYQAPPSMGFSGQQYWSGVPLPSPNDLRCVDLFLGSILFHWWICLLFWPIPCCFD